MEYKGYIYILCNKNRNVLYVGLTDNLGRRLYEHKNHLFKNSFTDKYNVEYLVYYECFSDIKNVVLREIEVKKWNRNKKEALINNFNPEWKDLSQRFS